MSTVQAASDHPSLQPRCVCGRTFAKLFGLRIHQRTCVQHAAELAVRPILCAHAHLAGAGAHWRLPSETCPLLLRAEQVLPDGYRGVTLS